MSYKKLLIALPLVACLASCGNITATTEISNDDISTTSESISEVNEPTCPFASFESSAVRVTTAAFVPYLLEVDESNVNNLSDALINLSWEKISPDTEYMGGETQLVFVNNNGNPFKLVFYADGVIDYEYNGVVEKYKVSDENIFSLVYEIAHPENFEDITDTLIWCAPEYLTNEKVWNEHNYQLIDVEPQCKPSFGFDFELPDTLSYEVSQTDDEPTSNLSAIIYPKDAYTPIISIEYVNGFSVCGTGLETKSIDFNGCSAIQGFYDGSEMWSYISLADDYEGCVFLMQDDKLFNQYADEMNIILETLHFRKYE